MASTNALFHCLVLLILATYALAGKFKAPHVEVPVPPFADMDMAARHELWMAEHGREYKDAVEKELRFKIFKQNVQYIESVNKRGDRKYKLGLNKFADLTNEEFVASHTGFAPKHSHVAKKTTPTKNFGYANLSDVPSSMDWRSEGAVTAIKDQGTCGCCWAFSAVAAIEGIHQIKTGELTSLSEQQLVDCDINGKDHGCGGGLMGDAFEFVITNGGLTTETEYPYQGSGGTCNSATTPAATITAYEVLPSNDELSILQAASKQPVSVSIEGSGRDFQFYKGSGVFTGDCGTDTHHAVTIIGYGTETDGTKYWLIKNSWGSSWGDNGYGKIQRDVGAPEGLCGIAMYATYPVV